jgi:single-strand selective monofunctional uracil DNA glycosylase
VSTDSPIARQVWNAGRALSRSMRGLTFAAPVAFVYNPLDYASTAHRVYVDRFANCRKKTLFLGMNPGPFGMAQTGVPFGEVAMVRDWMGIEAKIKRPPAEHPKRPITGFDCTRSEVSGARLWGAVAEHWGTPENFFADNFVVNYCPLLFVEESGRNRTPDKVPVTEREPIYAACDRHLRKLVDVLAPDLLVGVGAFAADRARRTLGTDGLRIETVLHPSPASPRANRGWKEQAAQELMAMGLCR